MRFRFSQRAAKARAFYNAAAMNLSRMSRALLATASGVALALAFPLYNLSILGWIAPAMLIVAVMKETPRFAFLLGWLQGAAFYGLSVPWFYTVMRQYGPLPVLQAGAVFALVIFATALFHAAFACAVAWIGRSSVTRACVAAPLLWVTMEFGMMHLPDIGFPWNLLGYVAARNLAFVQLTAVAGIFGLSLLVASYSALTAWVVLEVLNAQKAGPRFVVGEDYRADRDRTSWARVSFRKPKQIMSPTWSRPIFPWLRAIRRIGCKHMQTKWINLSESA